MVAADTSVVDERVGCLCGAGCKGVDEALSSSNSRGREVLGSEQSVLVNGLLEAVHRMALLVVAIENEEAVIEGCQLLHDGLFDLIQGVTAGVVTGEGG